jgi:hypothetical protein
MSEQEVQMKAHHLFSLFVLASLCLTSCTGGATVPPANTTATFIASRAGAAAPAITLNPTAGTVNARVTVTGSGFSAGTRVGLYVGSTIYAVAVASPDGKVTLAFAVPDKLPDGTSTADQDLAIMLANDDQSLKATASFRVQQATPTQPPTLIPAATPTPKSSGEPTGYVNFDFLNLRAGPGTNYDIVARLNRNQAMSLLERDGDSTWARVRVPGGTEGWVSTQYITTTVSIASLPVVASGSPTPTSSRPARTATPPVPTPGQPVATTAPGAANEQDKAVAAAIGFYAQWASGAGPHGNLEKALQYVSKALADQIRADNSALLRLLDVPARPQYTRVEMQKFDGTTGVARATLKIGDSERVVDTTLAKEDDAWVIVKFQPVKP